MKLSWIAALLIVSPLLPARAATYYVSSMQGSDANAGTSSAKPWRTLHRVNEASFLPGDRILFASGSSWQEQLAPTSSGSEAAPIMLDHYGNGSLPHIAGDGTHEDAVLLRNVQNIEVRHLEITNAAGTDAAGIALPRRGVQLTLDNYGTAKHIILANLYVHDVYGTDKRKDNGGIVFRTNGNTTPSRFDGLTIERNIVWKVDRSGIVAESYHARRTHWYPSLHVIIRDNYVDDIGGDGIVPWATDGALVEHNIARRCNQRSTEYNAGIWQWSTDNTLLRLNEAFETRGTHDGEGFDSDYNSRNTHFEYNYAHDNDGGFLLICTPVTRDEVNNVGNVGTLVQHNISRNDKTRLINLSGANDVTVSQNAFYVGAGHDVQMLVSEWKGWSHNATFEDNSFYVNGGTLHFGHQISKDEAGVYTIAAGWGAAEEIVYKNNHYFGVVADPPSDYPAAQSAHSVAAGPHIDWNEPVFDPAQPAEFVAFMTAHRAWMIKLFQQQFGKTP